MFLAFLALGLTSFGGPIAHLGYFRTQFVERRKWLDDPGYADLVSLCQFLPGPASSLTTASNSASSKISRRSVISIRCFNSARRIRTRPLSRRLRISCFNL